MQSSRFKRATEPLHSRNAERSDRRLMGSGRKTAQAHRAQSPQGHLTETANASEVLGRKRATRSHSYEANEGPQQSEEPKRTEPGGTFKKNQTQPPPPNAPAGEPNISVKGLRAAESDEAAIKTGN